MLYGKNLLLVLCIPENALVLRGNAWLIDTIESKMLVKGLVFGISKIVFLGNIGLVGMKI
jgi:hypothetical protein